MAAGQWVLLAFKVIAVAGAWGCSRGRDKAQALSLVLLIVARGQRA